MRKILLIFSVIFSLSLSANAQLTLNDITLPAKLSYHDQTLILNGGGIRSKFIFKLYTIGLYLTEKNSDGNTILKENKTMAVRFEISSDMINSDNMSEAINEGFDKSTNGNTSVIRQRIDEMLKTFSSEEILIGDLFEIVFTPDKGSEIYKNGELKSTIKGRDFKEALFGIWIAENSVSSSLKKQLLDK